MTSPETPRPWILFLVLAAAWVAHGSVLGADWIGDDAALVRDSAVVSRGPAGVGAAFGQDAWAGEAERGVWRPLAVYSFCLEWPLWAPGDGDPPAPFGFHLTSLFLHALAAVLLLQVGRRLAPKRPALVAGTALVFAVHPLHTQAVVSLAGRADLLALVFSLLTVWTWVEAGKGRQALLPLSALSFFLALLSKETAAGLPLVLLLLDGGTPDSARSSRRGGARLAALGVMLVPVALWALRWPWPLPDLRAGLDGLGASTTRFFVPTGLVPDLFAATQGFKDLWISPVALWTGVAVLASGALSLLGWRARGGPVALALGSTALLWSVAVLVSPAGLPLLPRFAYVPGIGLSLLGGVLFRVLWTWPRGRVAGRVAAAVLLAALGAITWSAGRACADAGAFERALIDQVPESDALLLRRARRLREDAVFERHRAAERVLDEEARDALVYGTTRQLRDARSYALAALRRSDPAEFADEGAADAYRELGFILRELGQVPDAVAQLRSALRLEPWLRDDDRRLSMPPARRALILETLRRLARSEEAVGDLREAAIHLEHAAELAPRDVHVLQAAGRTLSRAGEHVRARARLERALELASDPATRRLVEQDLEAARTTGRRVADNRLQAARQYIQDERQRDAVAAFEEALAADPTLLRAYEELAFLLGQWFGRYARAYEVITAAEAMLGEIGYPPEDAWWKRLSDLRAKIRQWEAEDD